MHVLEFTCLFSCSSSVTVPYVHKVKQDPDLTVAHLKFQKLLATLDNEMRERHLHLAGLWTPVFGRAFCWSSCNVEECIIKNNLNNGLKIFTENTFTHTILPITLQLGLLVITLTFSTDQEKQQKVVSQAKADL